MVVVKNEGARCLSMRRIGDKAILTGADEKGATDSVVCTQRTATSLHSQNIFTPTSEGVSLIGVKFRLGERNDPVVRETPVFKSSN